MVRVQFFLFSVFLFFLFARGLLFDSPFSLNFFFFFYFSSRRGTGRAQLRANGDREDGLPEDIINPVQRGRADRQQYMVAPDREVPQGFVMPTTFPVRILLQEAKDLTLSTGENSVQDVEYILLDVYYFERH
jgi:hypothetical protein